MVTSNPRAQDHPLRKNAFIHKLYSMLNEESLSHLIWWSGSPKGHTFSLCPGNEFAAALGGYFKHGNVASFVRQLHMYGFHKVSVSLSACATQSSPIWEFHHSSGKFRQGDEAALAQIRRRSQVNPYRNSSGERWDIVPHIQPSLDRQSITPQYDTYFQGYPQPSVSPQSGLAQQYPASAYTDRNVYSIQYSQGQPRLQQSFHSPIYFSTPEAAVYPSTTTPSLDNPGPFSWNGIKPQYFHRVPSEIAFNHASRAAQTSCLSPLYQPYAPHESRSNKFHIMMQSPGNAQTNMITSRLAEKMQSSQEAESRKVPALPSAKDTSFSLPRSVTSTTRGTRLTDQESSEHPRIGSNTSQNRPLFEFRKPVEGSEFRRSGIPSLLCDPFTKDGSSSLSISFSQQLGAPAPIPSVSRSFVVSHGYIHQSPPPTLPASSRSSPLSQTAKLDSLSMAPFRSDDMRKALLADTNGNSVADRIRHSLVGLDSTRPPQTNALMRSVDSIDTQQFSIFSNGSSISSTSTERLLSVGTLPQLAPSTSSKDMKVHEAVFYTDNSRLSPPPICQNHTKIQPKECLPTTSTSHKASDAASRHPKLPKLDFMLDLHGDSCSNNRPNDISGD